MLRLRQIPAHEAPQHRTVTLDVTVPGPHGTRLAAIVVLEQSAGFGHWAPIEFYPYVTSPATGADSEPANASPTPPRT